eukprot:8691694-Alexandrium_andersonii.AAC.1
MNTQPCSPGDPANALSRAEEGGGAKRQRLLSVQKLLRVLEARTAWPQKRPENWPRSSRGG